MSIRVEKAGILDTIQDLGRLGYRDQGINPGGAMDRAALRIGNILLGNEENAPVLEMHFPAPRLLFEAGTDLVVTGAEFSPEIDGSPVENWRVQSAKEGSTLQLKKKLKGSRAYLAVRGGFEITEWLGSASTNLFASSGGFEGRKLRSGDLLPCPAAAPSRGDFPAAGPDIVPAYTRHCVLRATAAPESDLLTAESANRFFTDTYEVGAGSDRMGYRLKGPRLRLLDDLELVSSPVNFGTVQLLPDGNPVILMADAQTTGGYPRIAQVISADLPLAGQLGQGDTVSFREVSPEDALSAAARFERDLCFLKLGIRLFESSK